MGTGAGDPPRDFALTIRELTNNPLLKLIDLVEEPREEIEYLRGVLEPLLGDELQGSEVGILSYRYTELLC